MSDKVFPHPCSRYICETLHLPFHKTGQPIVNPTNILEWGFQMNCGECGRTWIVNQKGEQVSP